MTKRIILLIMALIVAVLLCFFITSYIYPFGYEEYVLKYAEENNLDETLVFAQIKAESNFDASAVSKKGAVGLMQIMPSTGAWCADKMGIEFEEEMLKKPEFNIKIGCWYMAYLIEKTGSKEWALAAYNGGISNVYSWQKAGLEIDKIPFKETRKYVKNVLRAEKIYRYLQ